MEDVASFMPTLFPDDLSCFKEVVEHPRAGAEDVKANFDLEEGRVNLTAPHETIFILSGLIPNRKGPP